MNWPSVDVKMSAMRTARPKGQPTVPPGDLTADNADGYAGDSHSAQVMHVLSPTPRRLDPGRGPLIWHDCRIRCVV